MTNYIGDFVEDDTVILVFNTFSSNDPSASVTITNFINTDVHIHKDDGLTQRNNAAGITVSVDFDTITGSHMIKIDTNDNTVAGFWVAGADYFVRIEGTTVDAGTVNAFVGHFSIENRSGLKPTVAGRTLDVTATGAAGIDWGNVENKTTANDLSATDIQLVDTTTTNTDMRGTDSANTVVPDAAGVAPTAAEINAEVDTALADINLDHLVGTATAIPAIPAGTYFDQMLDDGTAVFDRTTDSLQAVRDRGDAAWTTGAGGSAPTVGQIADAVWDELLAGHAIADSTGELLNDWQNGGRLDLLLDAIPTTAMRGTDNALLAASINLTAGAVDTVTTNTDMRGTDSAATAAALATVDTVVDAVKAKTDQLTFTKANEVDANTQSINGAEVIGDGNLTPWDGV